MHRHTTVALAILSWCIFFAPTHIRGKEPQAKIARWITELGHPTYSVRVTAQQNLINAGAESIPQLERAAQGENIEARQGSRAVLERLFISGDDMVATAAQSAIRNSHTRSEYERICCKRTLRILERHKPVCAYNKQMAIVRLSLGDSANRLLSTDFQALRYCQLLQSLSLSTSTTSDDLKSIPLLPNLEVLYLRDTSVENDGLVHLKRLSSLKELVLTNTKVTGKGLVHLKDMTNLASLVLNGTKIGDENLGELKGFANRDGLIIALCRTNITDHGIKNLLELGIEALYLGNTKITDNAVEYLGKMHTLKVLNIQSTEITKKGYRAIQKSLPNCDVVYRGRSVE